MKWSNLCNSKPTGGFGLRNTDQRNLVAISKLAWNVAMKKDNLWVKWVSEVYVQEATWESYVAPNSSSWPWKYICEAKNNLTQRLNSASWMTDAAFSIRKYYQALRREEVQVQWRKMVWNRFSQPKQRMILWLAVQNRLKIKIGR